MTECSISFPGPVSRATVSRIVIDYMKYILYYRGQFPLPLDQLKEFLLKSSDLTSSSTEVFIDGNKVYSDSSDRPDSVLAPRSNILLNRAKKNFMDCISKFDVFFNNLLTILETIDVSEVVLNLGPNIMNPKEMYRITLPILCPEPECNTDYASLQKCKLKFFRDILQSNMWSDLKTDSLLSVSVLLLLENGVDIAENMELKSFYSFPKSSKQRIVSFSAKCVHLNGGTVELQTVTQPESSAHKVSSEKKGLWVKLKPDLRGFKAFSECRTREVL